MRLVGVGVGPGDPELVTVKAVRELREAAVVFVPVTDTGEVGRAEATVLAYVEPDRVRRLGSPSTTTRPATPPGTLRVRGG